MTVKLLKTHGKKVYTEEEIHLLFTKLILPREDYLESYLEAIGEEENDNFFGKGREKTLFTELKNYREDRNLPKERVPSHIYWLVDQKDFLGEISIRHRLTPALMNYGGHVGYAVKKSKRGLGYGKEMASYAMEKARELGLKELLITCDDSNTVSAKIIESLGGQLENKVINFVEGKHVLTRRYGVQLQ